MLTMDQKYRIKILHRFEAKSMRQIAKETGNDFKTVKKYLDMEDFNAKPPARQTRTSKPDTYEESVRKVGPGLFRSQSGWKTVCRIHSLNLPVLY